MSIIPNEAEKIEVEGATVDFFKSIKDGCSVYYFDTSKCGPPDPMVNAMVGLQLLDEKSSLVMINHKAPAGLFPKIEHDFNYEVTELDDGRAKMVFTKKDDSESKTDFNSTNCHG